MGRKKMKAKTEDRIDIRLRVDADIHRRIQAAADREGNSVAAYIRAAVVRDLERREMRNTE
jgi:predicted HicB family RNase H-like nuclease